MNPIEAEETASAPIDNWGTGLANNSIRVDSPVGTLVERQCLPDDMCRQGSMRVREMRNSGMGSVGFVIAYGPCCERAGQGKCEQRGRDAVSKSRSVVQQSEHVPSLYFRILYCDGFKIRRSA
jgi:hypothetical protein